MASTKRPREIAVLLTTCPQWTSDGELCAEDRSLLLHRLMQIDPLLNDPQPLLVATPGWRG